MLDLIRHAEVIELRMNRPPVNALSPDLIRALREAVEAAPGEGARALILSGSPGLFSAGLDVPTLLTLDRAGMTAVWTDFFALCGALGCSPIPTVAALTGHAPAGGAVLSIFCDYRIMARGAYRIGLNEVQVGLSVPEVIQSALRRLVGPHRAERLMVAGQMIESDQALASGFVDELVGPDQVVTRALHWTHELTALPPQSMSTTRRIARADFHEMFADAARMDIAGFVDGWFSAESQQTLQALVAKLKAKSG